MPRSTVVAMLTAVLIAPACGDGDDTTEPDSGVPATGAAVWTHLQQENYRQTWNLWPGTTEKYTSVHGGPDDVLLTTYVNSLALGAITSKPGSMPAGAIIVTENYMLDGELAAITTMYKVRGYDAQHNDWFWVMYTPSGAVDAEGRVAMCQNCHIAQASNDYIFLSPLN
jgi:hypothetical protein